jgi:hypothetical protein
MAECRKKWQKTATLEIIWQFNVARIAGITGFFGHDRKKASRGSPDGADPLPFPTSF